MSWLCLFMHCKWRHVVNAELPGLPRVQCGLYQCRRCKSLSWGSYR